VYIHIDLLSHYRTQRNHATINTVYYMRGSAGQTYVVLSCIWLNHAIVGVT